MHTALQTLLSSHLYVSKEILVLLIVESHWISGEFLERRFPLFLSLFFLCSGFRAQEQITVIDPEFIRSSSLSKAMDAISDRNAKA